METIYKVVQYEDITDAMMNDASKLFSENYGIWGSHGFGTLGSRVKMSPSRLRDQCLPKGSHSSYVAVTINQVLVGNAFACRWEYEGQQVCWITQLVVHREYRGHNIATILLMQLINHDDDVVGIMSSHPAACKALSKVAGIPIKNIELDFAQIHAANIIAASPVQYIRTATLASSLFDPNHTSGMVSGVDSGFFVDHAEPLKALALVRNNGNWPLGELPDGHEFLLLIKRPDNRYSPELPLPNFSQRSTLNIEAGQSALLSRN